MEAEYIATSKVAKEAVWLKKFLSYLEVVPNMDKPITLYCDISDAVANSKDPCQNPDIGQSDRSIHKDAVRETFLQTRRINGSKRNALPLLLHSGRLL